MLVTIPQSLTIGEYFNFDRFNETVLTVGRQFTPTAVHEPGSAAAEALAQANLLGRITLDDGRNAQNPDPAIHPNGDVFDLGNRFRGGDTVAERHGRARLRVRPVPDPADRGRRLHGDQPAPGGARGRRRQPEGRLLQRAQLLHDLAQSARPRRGRRGGVRAAADEDHRRDQRARRRRRRPDRDREQRRRRSTTCWTGSTRPRAPGRTSSSTPARSAPTRSRSPSSTSRRASRRSATSRSSTRRSIRASSTR